MDAPWQVALLIAAAVLIVTCPCALALAVPVVQVVATGRLLRRGILVKSPTALERLTTVDHVVFDKTGTLTEGRPDLTREGASWTEADLAAAAGLARASHHPLAWACRGPPPRARSAWAAAPSAACPRTAPEAARKCG
jgi:Cu2+-exporting ATPase